MIGELTALAPEDETWQRIGDWLTSYVARPHPELGRRGAVCPFVSQALATDSIALATFHVGPEPSLERMNLAIEQGIGSFQQLLRGERSPELVSLIVTFPDLGPEHWHLVDDGHRASKTRAVRDGLMLGQFHPQCDAPAAHNEAFPVNRAPIPLIVVRQMAPHDILFLEQDPVWLHHYKRTLERRGIAVDLWTAQRERAVGRGAT